MDLKKQNSMIKLLYIFLALICLASCTKDYNLTIKGVDFHPNKIYDNFSVNTEFLDSELIFGSDFSLDPAFGSGSFFGLELAK